MLSVVLTNAPTSNPAKLRTTTPCSTKKRAAKSFSRGLDPPESIHILPWPVGAVPVTWGFESRSVITMGAITSCALTTDTPRRNSAASLPIILAPPPAGLILARHVATSLFFATCLGCFVGSDLLDARSSGQLPAGTHTPSDRVRMQCASGPTNGTGVPKKKYAGTLPSLCPQSQYETPAWHS